MKVCFLGTAAAEGFPSLFCRCPHCAEARRRGGPNIRTRSSIMVDQDLKIDFPPDTLHHVLREGLDLAGVQDLLLTHTHSDHLAPAELAMRMPVYAHGCTGPLHIWGNDLAVAKCRSAIREEGGPGERFVFHRMAPFETYQTLSTLVTPLLADHDPYETCFLFYMEKGGKRLLYGHDTGWFPDRTWEWLEGRPVDLAILDCTNGQLPYRRNHMNIEAVIETRDRLRSIGCLSEKGQTVATHFSHNIGLLHEDLRRLLEPEGILPAFDGMVLDLV